MKNFIRWLLLLVAILMIISGYGLSNYRIFSSLTFGLFPKIWLSQIHSFLGLPFILLLLFHVLLALRFGHKR